MHTDVLNNIDLLVLMAGSNLNTMDIEEDLIEINKDIEDKKQKIADLKSIMVDARYFNASNELVDKNIEVSLKNKIARLNRKIKDIDLELNDVKRKEVNLNRDITSLKENITDTEKYLSILNSKLNNNLDDNYKEIVKREENHLNNLKEELKQKEEEYKTVLKDMELYKQAMDELNLKKASDEEKLEEVVNNLNNPKAYVDEELKKKDEDELNNLSNSLEELQKKKLAYLTDPNMIGADAKELVANNNFSKALDKIKELLAIVKEKPYMNITNLNTLDEELEKLENERIQLADYIDNKNYNEVNSDLIKKRIEYLNNQIKVNDADVKQYELISENINKDIANNLSVLINELEDELLKITKEIKDYKDLLSNLKKGKSRANIENAILKKEKEKEVMNSLLHNYKSDLLFQVNLANTMDKLIKKYNTDTKNKKDGVSELEHMSIVENNVKDYISEEADKDKLKKINEQIKQIKNRKKYTKTPDEIYDEIEMVLANSKVNNDVNTNNKNNDILEVDDLFDDALEEPKMYKVVEMIPAKTVKAENNGGASYGN